MFFRKIQKFMPKEYCNSIFALDYNKLYDDNIRLILTDLDNTLISYRDCLPTKELLLWKEQLEQKGFEIIVVSNSPKKRVRAFCQEFGTNYVYTATKPWKRGYRKALKLASKDYAMSQVISLGDQLMTDVYGSNRLGIQSYLIKAIDKKTERLVTRVNRSFERRILKKIKKDYPADYERLLAEYVCDTHEN